MADFETTNNFGTQMVNRGVVILPPVEDAIRLKERAEEIKREAKERAARQAAHQNAEYTEFEEVKDNNAAAQQTQDKPSVPDAMTLVRTNLIILMQVKGRYVRFEKLYEFIRDFFACRKPAKYDWYALFHFLYEKGYVTSTNKTKFSQHMCQPEWFGYLDKDNLPTADAIGDYNYLSGKNYLQWNNIEKPTSSKAGSTGIQSLLNHYINLDVNYNEDDILEPKRQ